MKAIISIIVIIAALAIPFGGVAILAAIAGANMPGAEAVLVQGFLIMVAGAGTLVAAMAAGNKIDN